MQKSKRTELHHLKYDQSDKLAWTIEVCGSCHWHIDPKKRKTLAKKTGKYIPEPYGTFYLNNISQEGNHWMGYHIIIGEVRKYEKKYGIQV